MSFRISLSGINAASAALDVTANNIANANTVGFKQSRVQFADVFAVSSNDLSTTASGSGVSVAAVTQNFSQGNIEFTNNNLDLAISGEGFFTVNGRDGLLYSRAGAFSVDRDGFVVNSDNQRLQVFPVSEGGNGIATGSLSDLRLMTSESAPKASTRAELGINLPANAPVPGEAFNPLDPDTYNHATSMTVFDSLGTPHTVTTYYRRFDAAADAQFVQTAATTLGASLVPPIALTATPDLTTGTVTYSAPLPDPATLSPTQRQLLDGLNTQAAAFANSVTATAANPADDPEGLRNWQQFVYIDGNAALNPTGQPRVETVSFNSDGSLRGLTNAAIPYQLPVVTGAQTVELTLDYTSATQFGREFSVNSLTQDGFSTGRMVGIEVAPSGIVSARFSNGQLQTLGQVALAIFNNPNGLRQVGGTQWAETFSSGAARLGEAGSSNFGLFQAGALESSNVNLTEQLVDMIQAQRNFQANAQMIQTADQITQVVLQLR